MPILTHNGKGIVSFGKAIQTDLPIYSITLQSVQGGNISANPMSGRPGTNITLSNTANIGYEFSNYYVNGVSTTNDTFSLTSNTNVSAKFTGFDAVQIGSQIWMAKNLDVTADMGSSGVRKQTFTGASASLGTVCFYPQRAIQKAVSGITGWHLPTSSEWLTLYNYLGANSASVKKLKATDGWYVSGNINLNGTDDYGFGMKGWGYWGYMNGAASNQNISVLQEGWFWSNEWDSSRGQHCVRFYTQNLNQYSGKMVTAGSPSYNYSLPWLPIRLIKD